MPIKKSLFCSLFLHGLIVVFILNYKAPIIYSFEQPLQAELWEDNTIMSPSPRGAASNKPKLTIKPVTINKAEINPIHAVKDRNQTKYLLPKEQIKTYPHKAEKSEINIKQKVKLVPDNLHNTNLVNKKNLVNKPSLSHSNETTQQKVQSIEKTSSLPKKNIKPENINTTNNKENIKDIIKDKQHIEKTRQENLARLMQASNNDNLKANLNNKTSNVNISPNSIVSTGLSSGYISKIQNIIKRNINYHGENANASVKIRIDAQGIILSKKIIKSSGNSDFDKSVLEAIENSDPLPVPESGKGIDINLHFSPH